MEIRLSGLQETRWQGIRTAGYQVKERKTEDIISELEIRDLDPSLRPIRLRTLGTSSGQATLRAGYTQGKVPTLRMKAVIRELEIRELERKKEKGRLLFAQGPP